MADAAAIVSATASPALAEAVLRDALDAFPYVRLRVAGTCMAPALRPGDVVHVAGVAARAPRLRDVVLVWGPAGPLLHRLVWGPPLARGRWRTKADRAPLWDAAVSPRDVLGTIIAVDRDGAPAPVAGGLRAGLASLLGGAVFWIRERLSSRRRCPPSP